MRKNVLVSVFRGSVAAKAVIVAILVLGLGIFGVCMTAFADVAAEDRAEVSDYRARLNYHDVSGVDFDFSMADEGAAYPRNWGRLPESYSSSAYADWNFEVQKDYVTPVKDQMPYGTCWAHAAISAVETGYIMSQGITDVESVNFNEYHLVHYTYDTPADPLGLFGGDTNRLAKGETFLNAGGNNKITAGVLVNWIGVSDSMEFTSADVEREHSDALGYEAAAHVEDVYYIAMPDMSAAGYKADMDTVKNMIMTYGSIVVSYYSDSMGGVEFDGYYYYPWESITNHVVTIVGWNDNISAYAFESYTGNRPPGKGAWLVKNSWGDEGEFGGYFWLSYYDKSIAADGYVYHVTTADNYDNNYQYDGSNVESYTTYRNKSAFANAFISDSTETLEAVGFYTYDTCMDYEIRVYKNLEADELPQHGDLVLTQRGSEIYAGFHTVELKDTLNIDKNERYAVVVTLEKADAYIYVALDRSASHGWISFDSYAKEGQSYIGYSADSLYDLNKGSTDYRPGTNVRLKAYTNERKADTTLNGLVQYENGWYYFKNGKVEPVTTIVNNENGWWYVKNGRVDFTYDGVGENENGTWYIENGQVDFGQSGVLERGGTWYYFQGGRVQYVDTVAENVNGWWYIDNGRVNFGYDGIGTNANGTWYIENGQVDFKQNGVLERGGTWYYFQGGRVQYIDTVAENVNGWWCIRNGRVDFTYHGVAKNAYGTWYIENGQVDFGYTGIYKDGAYQYEIKEGFVL